MASPTSQSWWAALLALVAIGLSAIPAWSASPPWQARTGGREFLVQPADAARPGFADVDPAASGLAFTNRIAESRHLTNQVFLNGSGLAAGDVDGDGLTDVFFCGFDNDNALFRNLGGWKFADATADAGVAMSGFDCTGAAFADLDGDGDLDLVVNTVTQGTHLLHNDGKGRFRPGTAVLNPGRGAMTAAIGDVDGDGFLDLYIANYRPNALMDMPNARMTFRKLGNRTVVDTVNGRPASDPEFRDRFAVNDAGGIEENGEPDVLFRNVGGTNFVEVPWTGGTFLDESGKPLTAAPRDWGLAAMFRDVNGDGRPDLYVCNDFQSPDRLWLNQGGGRLRLAPALALRRASLSSMAVDFADIDRDGRDDFLVLEMLSADHGQRMRWVRDGFPHRPTIGVFDDRPQVEQNTLQLARGDNTWSDVAEFAGLEATDWSWACAFVDVDLDGWEDVLIANGMERAGRDLDVAERLKSARAARRLTDREIFEARRMFPRLATRNLAFRNRGDLTFQDVSQDWGFDLPAVSQAIALADLDNDGDLDVIVGNLNAPAAIYRNGSAAPRVAVRLAGRPPNTRGVGARIEAHGGPVTQSQEIVAGGRYLSGDDPIRSFAAGTATNLTIRVAWPGGARSELRGVLPNSIVEIAEPPDGARPARGDSAPGTAATADRSNRIAFADVTEQLDHRHHELSADDFARQPLLPFKLSQPGPGLAWIDLDADGDDDLFVGAGQQGSIAFFRNDGQGRLRREDAPALRTPLPRDATALLGWPLATNRTVLLVALANYEDGTALGPAVIRWDPARPSTEELVSAAESSPGPMAMADIDGDGDLDLFVGGRAIPGRWPAPASSRFLRNDNGRLVLDAERSKALAGIGLVSGAVFSDLDDDGDADLALACEWGPIRILRHEKSGFVDATTNFGLAGFTGWWTSIAAGDFDNDGRMDLVAGNWGSNTPYQRHRLAASASPTAHRPLKLYHGDFNEDGVYDVVETHFDARLDKEVPNEQLNTLTATLPFLRGRFPSHDAYGKAGIAEVLGDAFRRAQVASATWLETTVFMNRGDRFEARPLPQAAQFAPAFGLCVADADGDGDEDLFLAQNFFAVRPPMPRYDGGLGVWLENDGTGGFHAVDPGRSGIRIFGEQRAAAVADFDRDGRIDLAVGQNGAATRLFRNTNAIPGLRVRLVGTPANPAGVGARFRWLDAPSPMQEIHLGAGYLSQDALTRVVARPKGANRLRVIWPGKQAREYAVDPAANGVTLTAE